MATALPRFTIMREDLSYVWAREYGDARDSTTILAALLAIGSAKRVLVLSDDDDGIWTLTANVTIPSNVTLELPAGVRLAGTGNLTIDGGLIALRHDWWQSTGVWLWVGSSATRMISKARIGNVALDTPLAIVSGGTGASTVAQAQINLGIVPAVNVQPYDPTLTAFAASTGSANTFWFFTGTDVGALTPLTATARNLLDDPDVPTMRGTLGLKALAILDTVGPSQIDNEAVTFAKLQPMTDSRLLGRAGVGVGEISVGTGLALSGGVLSLVGGAISGTGAANRVTYWTGVATQGFDEAYQYNPTTHVLTLPKLVLSEQISQALHLGENAVETGFSHAYMQFRDTITGATLAYHAALRAITTGVRSANSPTQLIGATIAAYLEQGGFSYTGAQVYGAVGVAATCFANSPLSNGGQVAALTIQTGNLANGALQTAVGMSILPGARSGTGTLDYYRGILIADPSAGIGEVMGIFGGVMAGATRWNLYMGGTAKNYLAGETGIGVGPTASMALSVGGNMTCSGRGTFANLSSGFEVTGYKFYAADYAGEWASAYTGLISAGTNRWNLYISGTAWNYVQGQLAIGMSTPTNAKVCVRYDHATLSGMHFFPTGQTDGAAIYFYNTASASVGAIFVNATSVNYYSASDVRLKDRIEPLGHALDVIQSLHPVTFHWRIDQSVGHGFLAHEVQAVVPNIVSGTPDAMDNTGQLIPQMLDPSKLVVWLVGAMQELVQRVATLTDRLAALEAA